MDGWMEGQKKKRELSGKDTWERAEEGDTHREKREHEKDNKRGADKNKQITVQRSTQLQHHCNLSIHNQLDVWFGRWILFLLSLALKESFKYQFVEPQQKYCLFGEEYFPYNAFPCKISEM